MSRSALDWKKEFDSEKFENTYYYDGNDLGCVLQDKNTIFKVWAPTAEKVVLNLYEAGMPYANDLLQTYELRLGEKGVWSIVIDQNLNGKYYTYSITVDGRTEETQDVYTKACGVNGKRSMVLDLKMTDPKGWDMDQYQYPAAILPVIYELHIRDFSYDKNSGVPEEFRGKYKAFTCERTTVENNGKKPTCLSYLKKLGITHVHLLPAFDFASVDENHINADQFNWGYDPANYNVPEGSYATDPFHGEVRIREFKEMVQALHEAGIGVIMDVVYNHTYGTDTCFQKTVPYYYYRLNDNGSFSNGSGCGNETASERKMFRKYMTDSVCYFVKEYHIDGFRFDLMGLHDVETMNAIRNALNQLPNGKNILMYGEPWTGGISAMKKDAAPAVKINCDKLSEGIAFFNDNTRDVIKGSVMDVRAKGFVNGCSNWHDAVKSCVLAWCNGAAGYRPHNQGQVISYVSAHDNWTLWDKLNYTMKEKPNFAAYDEDVLQKNKFAAGMVLTSLGTVFFQAGEEAARTKLGNGNTYNAPSDLNKLDWKRMYEYEDLIDYYKGMLKIRKQFSAYWSRDAKVQELVKFHYVEDGLVVFCIDRLNEYEHWRKLWISYSTKDDMMILDVPKGRRFLMSDGIRCYDRPLQASRIKEILVYPGVTVYGQV